MRSGEEIGRVERTDAAATDAAVARAVAAFEAWREVPAPRRGELVRLLGEELRREKDALGALVTLEVGKIAQEGLGGQGALDLLERGEDALGVDGEGLVVAGPGKFNVSLETPAFEDALLRYLRFGLCQHLDPPSP